jgi:hypothetical protein
MLPFDLTTEVLVMPKNSRIVVAVSATAIALSAASYGSVAYASTADNLSINSSATMNSHGPVSPAEPCPSGDSGGWNPLPGIQKAFCEAANSIGNAADNYRKGQEGR